MIRRRDDGAALVEAAFILPLLLVIILVLVDVGLVVLGASQASSAAADGARVGIIGFEEADGDPVVAADRQAIEAAVHARLPGQDVDEIEVACLEPDGDPLACEDARPNVDRVMVTVRWERAALTPLGGALPVHDVEGSATMVLVGRPEPATPVSVTTTTTTTEPPPGETTTTTVPPSCQLVSLTAQPANVDRQGTKNLSSDVEVIAVTDGAATCNPLVLAVVSDDANEHAMTMTKTSTTSYRLVIKRNVTGRRWTAGQKTARLIGAGGATVATDRPLFVVH